jgi:hypothetical protein
VGQSKYRFQRDIYKIKLKGDFYEKHN